jgi:hypothetical protein
MLNGLNASLIVEFHDSKLHAPDWPQSAQDDAENGIWHRIQQNHRYNTLLWQEEDKARRTDVPASEIAASKRLIDQYNQKRNDAVEAIDEALLLALDDCPHDEHARLNSETAGAMIDRLSILALKIFHMREQTQRVDAGAEHVANCIAKLERLAMQRHDLAGCLDQLLEDAQAGHAYFKVYRQFKMYNDPTLNPYLYGRGGAAQQNMGAK